MDILSPAEGEKEADFHARSFSASLPRRLRARFMVKLHEPQLALRAPFARFKFEISNLKFPVSARTGKW